MAEIGDRVDRAGAMRHAAELGWYAEPVGMSHRRHAGLARLARGVGAAVVVTLVAMAACTLERSGLRPGEPGGSPPLAGGSGGSPECETLADCPGSDAGCAPRLCDQRSCGTSNALAGTPCSEMGGEICDGNGMCVLDHGSPCIAGETCLSGFCVDGVCCASLCDAICATCNGATAGTCEPHAPATDPDMECGGGVCDGRDACASGTAVFADDYGGGFDQFGLRVAADAADNVVLFGDFYADINLGGSTFTSGNNNRSMFLAKLSPTGLHVWSRALPCTLEAYSFGLAVDSAGNVLVCGHHFNGLDLGAGSLQSAGDRDIFIAKFTSAGVLSWETRIGDFDLQRCVALAVDPSDNVIVATELAGSSDYGGGVITSAGGRDLVIAKYAPSGAFLWANRYGGTSSQYASAVAADTQGNLTVFGDFFGTIDFGGGALVNPGLDLDLYVARLDPMGNHLASATFGGSDGDDYAVGAALDAGGQVILAGSHGSTIDFGAGPVADAGMEDAFVVKLDAQLGHVWSRHLGDAVAQATMSVAVDDNDNVIAAGNFFGTISFDGVAMTTSVGGRDVFLAKYSAGGDLLWGQAFGSTNSQWGIGNATLSNGRVLMTGYFEDSIDFGTGLLTATSIDAYLAIFEP